jgi:hypothetical protein
MFVFFDPRFERINVVLSLIDTEEFPTALENDKLVIMRFIYKYSYSDSLFSKGHLTVLMKI